MTSDQSFQLNGEEMIISASSHQSDSDTLMIASPVLLSITASDISEISVSSDLKQVDLNVKILYDM